MNRKFFIWTSLVTALFIMLSGCVKQPTISEKVVDDRPAISFKLQSGAAPDSSYQVYVDNLAMGSLTQYRAGVAALRVLTGSHLIRVEKQGTKVYEETLYLGDGAVKEILVP